jgi:uncharacterized protein
MMPVHLRGHHFLCMLTYRGLGYSAEFTANMTEKISHIGLGAPVVLIEGPDDICTGMSKACMNASGHDCRGADILAMDQTARHAVEAVLGRDLATKVPLTKLELEALRLAFASGAIRAACDGCSWFEICTQIAADHYCGTHLLAAAP